MDGARVRFGHRTAFNYRGVWVLRVSRVPRTRRWLTFKSARSRFLAARRARREILLLSWREIRPGPTEYGIGTAYLAGNAALNRDETADI